MKFIINLGLGAFGIIAAGRRSRHTARGVARRAWTYAGRHYVSAAGGVGDLLPASQLVWYLKRERIRAARYA